MRYGLPFQGSKNKLARLIVNLLPSAEHMYDVFAGGCAVTHAALLSGKWKCVHFSDITDSVVLFRDCLDANIPDGSEWISREEFFRRKDKDPYVRLIWSFGNDQRSYLYSREIEPYKKAVHEMIFASTPNERRLKFREVCKLIPYVLGLNGSGVRRISDQESIERLQRLQTIQNSTDYRARRGGWPSKTPSFGGEYEMRIADYRDIDILPNSVIYADPPYKNTGNYNKRYFDHQVFYDWCEKQTNPVFISEYRMPEDRFTCIAQFERTSTMCATNNGKKETEKIFMPKLQAEAYLKKEYRQLELFE